MPFEFRFVQHYNIVRKKGGRNGELGQNIEVFMTTVANITIKLANLMTEDGVERRC